MYSIVASAALIGIDSRIVQVEADVCDGMPMFEMVGDLASEVKEAKERVRAAIRNTKIKLNPKKITINLYPADLRKSGTGFDLPMAMAILAAYGLISKEHIKHTLFIGELSLNGEIHEVRGILPMMLTAREAGYKKIVIPSKNIEEASFIKGIKIIPVNTLFDTIQKIKKNERNNIIIEETHSSESKYSCDFALINGQKSLRRALFVSACGMHNILLVGPPGAGKTMAAKALPSILPPLNEDEGLELAKIYSVCGMLTQRSNLYERPFRNPHHTITAQALIGGGKVPCPGEISFAHGGVLFLDELTEYKKSILETLRQPLEEKKIQLNRISGNITFPADFLLAGAMNPCTCGYYPDRNKCICSDLAIQKHLKKLSRPLLDRIDMCVEASRIKWSELNSKTNNESSMEIRSKVIEVHKRQKKRFLGTNILYNSQIPGNKIDRYCILEPKARKLIEQIFERLDLSTRGYYKILKTARTIADIEQNFDITPGNISEALYYRSMNFYEWE